MGARIGKKDGIPWRGTSLQIRTGAETARWGLIAMPSLLIKTP